MNASVRSVKFTGRMPLTLMVHGCYPSHQVSMVNSHFMERGGLPEGVAALFRWGRAAGAYLADRPMKWVFIYHRDLV